MIKNFFEQQQISYQMHYTQSNGHGAELAREGIRKGFRQIMTMGGDGTNNEVINGILSQKIVRSDQILYTLLPIGTGNDWIKSHGIPQKIRSYLKGFQSGSTNYQDVGLVRYQKNGQTAERYFANIAGLAYDAYVVRLIAGLKSFIPSKLFYTFYLLKCLFQYSLKRACAQFDDQVVENHFYSINVGIGRYAGSGLIVVPHAVPDDGELAITLIGKVSKIGVLLNYYRFFNGTIGGHSKVQLHKTKKLSVRSLERDPVLLEVDGEFIGTTPAHFEILPKALKVWVPKMDGSKF